MNANELADALNEGDVSHITMDEAATMLRQQQAEIEALKNRNWDLVSEPWGFDRQPAKEYKPNQTLECSFDLAGLKPQAKTLTDEVYFCSRCGKRLGDGIHTCTPPADILRKAQEK